MAFDSKGAGFFNIGVSPASENHTLPAGGVAVIAAITYFATDAVQVSAVTVGGESCTRIGGVNQGGTESVEMWGKFTSLSGVQAVQVTFGAGASHVNCQSLAYTGRDSTTPFGTAVTNTTAAASSLAVTITAASGDDLGDVIVNNNGGFPYNAPTNATQQQTDDSWGNNSWSSADNVAGNTTVTENDSGSAGMAMIGVAIKKTAGAAAAALPGHGQLLAMRRNRAIYHG